MKYLRIKAGKKAVKKLEEHGLTPDLVRIMAGAAGGPKWIILYALDRFLMQSFFTDPSQLLHFIGGSIGAWRSAAYLLSDPTTALDRLQEGYLNQKYQRPLTKDEVTETCQDIILNMLGTSGTQEILNHPYRKLHIITSRALFHSEEWTDRQLKWALGKAAFHNFLNRKNLDKHFRRDIFSTSINNNILEHDELTTNWLPLEKKNLVSALKASGAIPMVIHPVRMYGYDYWDGGITDYHLDLKFGLEDGVVLYPHFMSNIIPGWFDKFHPFRKSKHHENTVLLYPSEEFISLLPDRKLTSREDFYTYRNDPDLRIRKWYQAADLGKYLVDDFVAMLKPEELMENLQQF